MKISRENIYYTQQQLLSELAAMTADGTDADQAKLAAYMSGVIDTTNAILKMYDEVSAL